MPNVPNFVHQSPNKAREGRGVSSKTTDPRPKATHTMCASRGTPPLHKSTAPNLRTLRQSSADSYKSN